MKKAVTLAAIAGLSLASDFQDSELVARLPSKPAVNGRTGGHIFFDDDELYGESRTKLSIFNKKKGETNEKKVETNEKTEHDDELMTVWEFLKAQPIPERQVLDVRTRVPVVSVLPAEQPKPEEENNKPKERSNFSIFDRKMAERSVVDVQKQAKVPVSIIETRKTEEEAENPNKPKRSTFSIFDRKEGEKTDEEKHHGKGATRSNFSILNRRQVNSQDVQHAKRDLEDLVSKLLRHKYVKSGNEFFGLRDLKKGEDRDSKKANVLKLDSEEDNEFYGMRDWKRRDKDSDKAGVLGFDSEEDNELYGMRDWRRERDSGKAGVLGLDSEEDNEFYGMRDWKRRDKDSDKAVVLGFDSEDNEFRVLGSLIHDGLEIYRDVKNKDYGNAVSHGIKAARDVHELTKKRNFLGN